jgi:hypothetical protein
LLVVFALPPTAVLAQQDNASQRRNQDRSPLEAAPATAKEEQKQTEAAPAKAEGPQGPTEDAAVQTQEDGKLISVPGGKSLGMSILGNQEAPKALVIVPWKRSELGNAMGTSTMLDDSKLPVDKEVFMRMLSYYEISAGGAPAKDNAAPAAIDTSAFRRKQ